MLCWIVRGSRKAAAKELKINETSLSKWKEDRPAIWEKLLNDYSKQIDVGMTGTIREAAVKVGVEINAVMEQMAGKAKMISPEKLAQTAQQLSVAMTNLNNMAAMLEGRPTVITEHRSAPELLAKIQAEFPGVIDSTAIEVGNSQDTLLQSGHAQDSEGAAPARTPEQPVPE